MSSKQGTVVLREEVLDDELLQQMENEEDVLDCDALLPASSAILGMKLGDQVCRSSAGRSSMMGLSAFGLESHRESQENLPELPSEEHLIGDDATENEDVEMDDLVALLISAEIDDALMLMAELNHPRLTFDQQQQQQYH